jgi:integrase
MYHVVTRPGGKLVREPVGHNRKLAERRLRAIQVQVDEDQYEAPSNKKFEVWADEWLANLRRRETTKRVYGVTLEYAKQAFGSKPVRKLRASDIRAFLEHIERVNRERNKPKEESAARPKEVSPTTLAKHLRQLGACLEAARRERLITENPVRNLHSTDRPKAGKKRPSYFTDDELARLWPELVDRPVYSYLCRLAVTTGLRFGELAALRWERDVFVLDGELLVSHTYSPGVGETATKDDEPRTVDLTPQARQLLEEWLKVSGDEGLVFERETGGYLDDGQMLKALYAAMDRAGIPRISERGGKRTFHSFRNTFARIALEAGSELAWVQGQLGHSSITLTRDTYGAWSRKAEKVAAERLAGAFAV